MNNFQNEADELIELHKVQILRLERIKELQIWIKNIKTNKTFPPTQLDRLRMKKWDAEIRLQFYNYQLDNQELQ